MTTLTTPPKSSDLVKFPAFRSYEKSRQLSNNAMMGLLAGSQLSAHFLQLTQGSNQILSRIFPNVPHIGRFDLTSESASEVLRNADSHLGNMAVPLVLAMHEDMLRTSAEILKEEGMCTSAQASANLVNLHGNISSATGKIYSPDMLSYIDTLRLMRNSLIHSGGKASAALVNSLSSWNDNMTEGWKTITKRNPKNIAINDVIDFRHGEMIAALAFTKRLDRETNVFLSMSVPRQTWIRYIVDETSDMQKNILRGNPKLALKKASGIARTYYPSLQVTKQELQEEIDRR